MALPFAYFYTPKIHDSTSMFLDDLNRAHQFNSSHADIVNRLIFISQKQPDRITQKSTAVVNYLHCNIKNNIEILNSLECLNHIYPLISFEAKKIITALLIQKYSSKSQYPQQLNKIKGFNLSLIEPFFKLVSLLTQWFLNQIEQKEYLKVELHQVQYLINSVHLITLYEFQTEISYCAEQINNHMLALYRILSQNCLILKTITSSEQISKKIIALLFYFIANYQFDPSGNILQARVLIYSIGQIISMLTNQIRDLDDRMMTLLFSRIRTAALGKNKIRQNQKINDIIIRATINILVADWSMQREFFWLWKCKDVWNLLKINPSKQVQSINEIQLMVKEITRIIHANRNDSLS